MTTEPLKSAYLRTQVMTASPVQLRLMLLDGALKFAERARDGLDRRDFEAAFIGLSRCRDIITELINGLRPEQDPDLCGKLSALYTYLFSRLLDAGSEKRVEPVDEVIGLLQYERETWAMLLEKLAAENSAASGLVDAPAAAAPPDATRVAGGLPLVGGRVSVQG